MYKKAVKIFQHTGFVQFTEDLRHRWLTRKKFGSWNAFHKGIVLDIAYSKVKDLSLSVHFENINFVKPSSP